MKKARRMANGRNVKLSRRGMRTRGKMRPTVRLADQLMKTTMADAADLEPATTFVNHRDDDDEDNLE